MLSPMYDAGTRHYYIDELARLKNGQFIIPVRWLEDNDGNVLADAYPVTLDNEVRGFLLQLWLILTNTQFVAHVVDGDVILVKSSELKDNFLDLMDLGLVPTWSGEFA